MTMTQESELLPCPFCGSENILEFGKQDDDWASVECRNCRAGTHKFENLQDAISAWNTRARLGKGEVKPVEVGDTELAALVVEAFNKAEKPENHIGLCAGYRIAQAILSRYKAMVAWYARDHYNAGWQAATAEADAKYLPVIEKLNKIDGILCITSHKYINLMHRYMPGFIDTLNEALALAKPLLAEKRGV